MDEKIFNVMFPAAFPNWKTFTVVLLGAFLALSLSGCGSSKAESSNTNVAAQAKTVNPKIVAAQVREVPKFIEATGTFQADETTDVAAETSGKVAQTLVSESSFVSTGDVLVRLDERDASLRLQQSRAAESQARSQLTQAEAQLKQSQANLGLDAGGNFTTDNIPAVLQARAVLISRLSDLKLAETTEKRFVNLLETGDTSRLVVDQRRNETEKARAAVNEARENQKAAENTARQSNQAISAQPRQCAKRAGGNRKRGRGDGSGGENRWRHNDSRAVFRLHQRAGDCAHQSDQSFASDSRKRSR